MKNKDSYNYDDIIDLPHHRSAVHPHMPLYDRAAQFAPFAALTGFGAAITESARPTDSRIDLDEHEKELLNARLLLLAERGGRAALTYFVPDERKAGGAYVTVTGGVKRVDRLAGAVVMEDGLRVSVSDIISIETDVL